MSPRPRRLIPSSGKHRQRHFSRPIAFPLDKDPQRGGTTPWQGARCFRVETKRTRNSRSRGMKSRWRMNREFLRGEDHSDEERRPFATRERAIALNVMDKNCRGSSLQRRRCGEKKVQSCCCKIDVTRRLNETKRNPKIETRRQRIM